MLMNGVIIIEIFAGKPIVCLIIHIAVYIVEGYLIIVSAKQRQL